MRVAIVALVLLVIVSFPLARTWHVSPDGTGDAPTIQAGVDSTAPGDTILLDDGTFIGDGNREIQITQTVVLRSENGPDYTTLYLDDHQGVHVTAADVVVEGITFEEGAPVHVFGGGIYVQGPRISVRNCRFQYCSGAGSGILFYSGATGACEVLNCAFLENSGVDIWDWSVMIYNYPDYVLFDGCLFANNVGCSLCSDRYVSIIVRNSTFNGNQGLAGEGSAITCGGPTEIENCIIAYSTGTSLPPIYSGLSSPDLSIRCTDIFGNTAAGQSADWVWDADPFDGIDGNLCMDPLFCGAASGDFSLYGNSPCLPENHPDGPGCGVIGAYGEGCPGSTHTEQTSWGSLKSLFR
ncbi:MAG: hypothetical protein JW958_04250 [Candidatus Eisenbacteria bacterium]|nr:hypothetical protein [Candidatus Eisenbacteria bacterium]